MDEAARQVPDGPPNAGSVSFTADLTHIPAERAFDAFRAGWEGQVGEAYPLPTFTSERPDGFQIQVRASKVADATIAAVRSDLLHGTTGGHFDEPDDGVLLHVIEQGTWHFADSRDDTPTALTAGQYAIRSLGRPTFEVASHATAKVLMVPAEPLRWMIRDRQLTGDAASGEMQLLLAHADMISTVVDQLGAVGAQAAHDALAELVKGVLRHRIDDAEPQLAPALVHYAQAIADRHVGDPDLSPTMLARSLNVSVRTLQRAFATVDESAAGYIRRRRLEHARRDLTHPTWAPSVSELAARWQFADSSHFIRAFKTAYGKTPAEFRRTRHQDLEGREPSA